MQAGSDAYRREYEEAVRQVLQAQVDDGEEEEDVGGVGLPVEPQATPSSAAHAPRRLFFARSGVMPTAGQSAVPQQEPETAVPRPQPHTFFGSIRTRNETVQGITSVLQSLVTPLRRRLGEVTQTLMRRDIFKKGIAVTNESTHPAELAFCRAHKRMMGALSGPEGQQRTARNRDEDIVRQWGAKVAKAAERDSDCSAREIREASGVSRRQYDQVLTPSLSHPFFQMYCLRCVRPFQKTIGLKDSKVTDVLA